MKWDLIWPAYVAFMLGYITSRIILVPIEIKVAYGIHLLKDWMRNEPHITDDMYDDAMSKLLSSPNANEIITNREQYKICPRCSTFKRSFYKEGRNRRCMDCEFAV